MLSLMCNQGLERRFESQDSEAAATLDRQTAVRAMDPIPPLPSDEPPRVKLLCSFGGSIIPRPHDSKLRYVGGDTRIVSLPRDVGFDELMLRMREIFEGVTALKYQQPDEELDALVSVVNDDDVTNMMEEYDKLGVDGLNKLRIFLFSGFDNEVIHFDIDDRETERRYVDALNSLSDLSGVENNVTLTPDQFMPPTGLPLLNLNRLNVPHPSAGSNIYQQGHTQVHGHADMSLPWSPAYISTGHLTAHEARANVPGSPSSCCCMALGDPHERMPEDRPWPHLNHQYEYHQPNYADNVVWLPNGVVASNKAGYPNNVGNSYNNNNHNVYEGSYSCENCGMAFSRQSDMRWRQGHHHMEHPSSLNEFVPHGRDVYSLTSENENQQFSNDLPNNERGWTAPHHHLEEPRTFVSGIGRLREHYTDGNGRNYILDGHLLNSSCFLHEDCRQIQPCNDLAHERFREQAIISGAHMHTYEHTVGSVSPIQGSGVEDSGLRSGNNPTNYGVDSHYHVLQGPNFVNAYRRKVQSSVHGGPSCEASNVISQSEGQLHPGTTRVLQGGSPTYISTAQDSQKMFGHDGLTVCTSSAQLHGPSDQFHIPPDNQGIAVICPTSIISDKDDISSVTSNQIKSKNGSESMEPIRSRCETQKLSGNHEEEHVGKLDAMNSHDIQKSSSPVNIHEQRFDLNGETVPDHSPSVQLAHQFDYNLPLKEEELSVRNLSFLPDLIASVKKAALEEVNDVKVRAQENDCSSESMKKSFHQLEHVNGEVGVANESFDENTNVSKIEPTKAEAEALARGLQTIKNNDLEEIRELGSGTYGAVYHGKWKGSDVAIKRIKATCFSGRPLERDHLIADFWKEALLLSLLHHPNVVSFYGIVRDGPDGSLATVTEFMVNGSLKQFLQKKDRTIDRRKRLIIAMDAAFGMEYLHGKNIVHFDLKCENLLVNMRDPQRPVCKIGDLGLSKVRQHTLVSGGVRGTLPWMAPELLSGKSNMVTEKIDVYSFGVVMWELLTGGEPYADMRCAAIIGGIVSNTLRPEIPQWCDPEWRSLMESCWASDPTERPSFAEISQKLRKMAAAMNVK